MVDPDYRESGFAGGSRGGGLVPRNMGLVPLMVQEARAWLTWSSRGLRPGLSGAGSRGHRDRPRLS